MRFPKKIAVFAAGIAAFMVVGVAFAAWTSNGTGTGTAQAKTAVSLTTSAVSASGATLYPGADGKATIKVNNNNDYPIRITDVTYGTAAATTATGGIGTCATGTDGGLVFTNQTGLTLDVAAHGNAHLRRERHPHERHVAQRLPGRHVHDPGDPHGRQQRHAVRPGRAANAEGGVDPSLGVVPEAVGLPASPTTAGRAGPPKCLEPR